MYIFVIYYKIINILVLGDANSGKTTFIIRYIEEVFKFITSTIGMNYKTKTYLYNDETVNLKLWDTAGQELFRIISRNLIQNADDISIFFDITRKETFSGVEYQLKEILSKKLIEEINLVLIRSKIDLSDREIFQKDAKKFADKNKIYYCEISSLTGIGIDEAFKEMVKPLIEKRNLNNGKSDTELRSFIKLRKNTKKKEKGGFCGNFFNFN